MTELKRPERYVQFESIKPKFKEITEFYTQKIADYQYRLKQLNEYADALENEISALKETPKVEVLLDDMAKPLVVVPQFVADYIETQKGNDFDRVGTLVCGHFSTLVYSHHAADDRSEKHSELHKWITDNLDTFIEAIVNGYTVEKPKEKLYFVKLPYVQTLNSYMCKSCSLGEFGYHKEYSSKEPNKICFSSRYDKKYSGGWQRQFTEQEIKDIDPRYLAFSVKVEED